MTEEQQTKPRLSVVMATYGRAETLRRVLNHLDKQELEASEYDVIVISDKSPDHTADVCRDMAEKVSYELHYLENDRNRGPGFSQNRGIRLARGGIILLMADDILQSPGSLKEQLDFHREHPEIGAAALGRVIQAPELATMSVFLRYWNPFRFDDLEGMTILPTYKFAALNLSIKRPFITEHGMFREDLGRFGPAAMEDMEVGYRLKPHGLMLYYLPEAWAHHYHVYTLDQAVARWRERGLNFDQFREVMPDPEVTVSHHDLRWKTFREYAGVLRRPNLLKGREKYFAWHLLREVVRRLVLNGITAPLVWRPILDRAEKWPWLADHMHTQIYRAYLYYQFRRGVLEGSHRR